MSDDKPASSGLGILYILLVTQAVSLIGNQVSSLSVGIAIFRQTGHITPLALISLFNILPTVLLSGVFGALADRLDRRLLMIAANAGLVVSNGLLLFSFASGSFKLWHLYALTFISGSFAALERPAFQASIAMLVPDRNRDRANALLQITSPSAGIIAPPIAGLLYAVVGVVGAIAVNVATFVLAIVVLLVVHIPKATQTADGAAMRGSIWRQSFDGFRYLGARPPLLGLFIYISLVNFIGGGIVVLTPPYILDRTGGPAALGLVMGALNLGALAGGLAMAAWGGPRPRINGLMPSSAIGASFLMLAGISQGAFGLGATLFVAMFMVPIANASLLSILQQKVAPDVQGRVFAAMSQLSGLLAPLAALVVGPLADRVFEPAVHTPSWHAVGWMVGAGPGAGMGLMFVIWGFVSLALNVGAYALPALRKIESILPDSQAAAPPPAMSPVTREPPASRTPDDRPVEVLP